MLNLNKLDVDAAFCISLDQDTHRRALFTEAADEVGLEFEYYIVKKNKKPELGCALSHQQLCQMALDKGWSRILILEDDCRFYNSDINIDHINDFLDHNNSWELFFLGAIIGDLWLTKHPNIARIQSACTHSYIVNLASCQKIVNFDFQSIGRAIDRVYKRELKAYSVFPLLTHQDAALESNLSSSRNNWAISSSSWEKNRKRQYFQAYLKNLHKWIFSLDP